MEKAPKYSYDVCFVVAAEAGEMVRRRVKAHGLLSVNIEHSVKKCNWAIDIMRRIV